MSNLMHFLDKMVYLFFLQKVMLRSKSVNICIVKISFAQHIFYRFFLKFAKIFIMLLYLIFIILLLLDSLSLFELDISLSQCIFLYFSNLLFIFFLFCALLYYYLVSASSIFLKLSLFNCFTFLPFFIFYFIFINLFINENFLQDF